MMRWVVAGSLALTGCRTASPPVNLDAPPAHALVISDARIAACPRSPGGVGATFRDTLPGGVSDAVQTQALALLPPAARRTALAAGLEPLIAEVLRARPRAGDPPSVAFLARRQQLDAALAALPPQLLAAEFEAECNIALMQDALAERGRDRDRWTQRYTVASLLVGAASVLVAGIWDLMGTTSSGPVVAGLVGAVATTGLGLATLAPPGRPIVFRHTPNLLAPVARGEDPDRLYPTFVFRLLTLPTATGAPTPRAQLLDAWREDLARDVPDDRRARVEALLWSAGGVYDDDTLTLRRRLYDTLESTLDAFARDVDLLNATLARLLRHDAAGGA
ncbi:MAG: hypothetical protein ACK5XT_17815 [Gemmatimonas sp.]|uniref:hypothetical protein n=1 Tax=Gemmatimonas sp. TaxID=1962908 RepID=UPI00391F871B|nr:hypothetical protein [Gemmatimonadota bacterium]